MKQAPFFVERLHFVGIGGIGMSGIADIMHHMGYSIQGSDQSDNVNVQRLRRMGIKIFVGHQASNIDGVDAVVISSAVPASNLEVIAAREKGIPIVKRAEMLAELMKLKWSISIAGSHGKTTTTSIMATILKQAQLDPTVINGGILNAIGANASLGKGDMMVVEADESDGSFQYLPSTMCVVTNIDPEHMEYYGNLDGLKEGFLNYIYRIPFYGVAVLFGDDPNIRSLLPKLSDKPTVLYGFGQENDAVISNVLEEKAGSTWALTLKKEGKVIENLFIPMTGRHNILNATAAVCIALRMNISLDCILQALKDFAGVKRRFTITGEINNILFVDDYAHHPTEIAAVLKAARVRQSGRLFAVVQPHRYTRLRDHFDDFVKSLTLSDEIFVTPLYTAGENPIDGVNQASLVKALQEAGAKTKAVASLENIFDLLSPKLQSDDIVLFMGAGDITQWAYRFPELYRDFLTESN